MADRAVPTGMLTFLFADGEGSTRLLCELGQRCGADELCIDYFSVSRGAIAALETLRRSHDLLAA